MDSDKAADCGGPFVSCQRQVGVRSSFSEQLHLLSSDSTMVMMMYFSDDGTISYRSLLEVICMKLIDHSEGATHERGRGLSMEYGTVSLAHQKKISDNSTADVTPNRFIPDGMGRMVNMEGIAYYNRIIDTLLEQGNVSLTMQKLVSRLLETALKIG
ncbi:hypothetical protein R1flu_014621 [Riccia fluitans]|uniref:Uncharacterized protein n=1 Tax=Riccia fluitans TaxID=41844 RepID=A0ABD1YHB8_9MARC